MRDAVARRFYGPRVAGNPLLGSLRINELRTPRRRRNRFPDRMTKTRTRNDTSLYDEVAGTRERQSHHHRRDRADSGRVAKPPSFSRTNAFPDEASEGNGACPFVSHAICCITRRRKCNFFPTISGRDVKLPAWKFALCLIMQRRFEWQCGFSYRCC